MLELLLLIGLCVVMGRLAELADRSPLVWGGLTFAVYLFVVVLLAVPFFSLIAAGVLVLSMMIFSNTAARRAA